MHWLYSHLMHLPDVCASTHVSARACVCPSKLTPHCRTTGKLFEIYNQTFSDNYRFSVSQKSLKKSCRLSMILCQIPSMHHTITDTQRLVDLYLFIPISLSSVCWTGHCTLQCKRVSGCKKWHRLVTRWNKHPCNWEQEVTLLSHVKMYTFVH